MSRQNLAFLAIATMLLGGCEANTLDARSDESFKASVSALSDGLPSEDRERFAKSLMLVGMSGFDGNLLALAANPEASVAAMRERLDGMTANEVLAAADQINAEREVRERDQVASEIGELEEKRDAAFAARAELAAFEVTKSRFIHDQNRYMQKNSIELSVRNGTEYAISKVTFAGTSATPGRSVAWFKGDFNYDVPGGLEPGENASWSLAPNMMSPMYSAKVQPGAVFTVEVVALAGADGETLFDSRWSDRDEKRLQSLQSQRLASK